MELQCNSQLARPQAGGEGRMGQRECRGMGRAKEHVGRRGVGRAEGMIGREWSVWGVPQTGRSMSVCVDQP